VLSVSVHAYLLKRNIATNIALATAPLNMYAKHSELRSAQKIFISLEKKDAVLWTRMINGLAIME
jgi:hypothetical protein